MFRLFVRNCSRTVTKAEAKISWNKDNKQLFGEVVRKTKRARKTKCDTETNAGKTLPEPILSSEMHWMLSSTQKRTRMLAKQYDNTERIVLNVPHPKEATKQPTTSGFADILKVPLIYNTHSDANLMQIPELTDFSEVPSVGKILQATMSDAARNALIKWKLSKIEELGEEGFRRLQKENLSRGLRFHNLLQDYFTGVLADDPEITETDALVWKSIQAVLPEIERKALFVEHRLVHPLLQYKGVVDCVSLIGSEVFCIEWKNSEKPKSTISATFDAPLQLCAYLGALNANSNGRGENAEIASGMVVVAYQNGRPADYYKLDEAELQKYWRAWLLRVQEYWIRYRDGTLPEPIF